MPEVVVLQCDAPGCEETGEVATITLDGKTCEVILGPKHRGPLVEIARWGRPAKRRPPARSKRRDTSEQRLLSLVDADDK